MFQKGWSPRLKILDAVRWRRREWNGTADKAGRYVVSNRQSFSVRDPSFKDIIAGARWIQTHSDGGVEAAGASAAATMIVWHETPQGIKRKLVSVRAEYIPDAATPFYCECLGLLAALQDLNEYTR